MPRSCPAEAIVDTGNTPKPPDMASDPSRAIRYATKRARNWFANHRGRNNINGMDADDIAQEALLSLIRTKADLKYIWNKTGFVITDQVRTDTGYRRKAKEPINMQGSEVISSAKPPAQDDDPCRTERIAIEMVESSGLPDIVKRIAIMRMQGRSFKTIASALGMSEAAMTYYTVKYAPDLHALANLPVPADLMRRVVRRENARKERRGKLANNSRKVKPDASSPPTSPSS